MGWRDDWLLVKDALAKMKELEDGWLDGEGKAPDPAGLDWLKSVFPKTFGIQTFFYPTPEGGVQMEWVTNPIAVSLEINLETHKGQYCSLNMKTDEFEEKVLDLDNDSSWEWIRRRLIK
jgi:hypothetical protein